MVNASWHYLGVGIIVLCAIGGLKLFQKMAVGGLIEFIRILDFDYQVNHLKTIFAKPSILAVEFYHFQKAILALVISPIIRQQEMPII